MHDTKISFFFCCLIIALFVAGCASPGSHYYPVTDSAPRHSTLGFSIAPPPGNGWFERHQEDSLYYLKKTQPQLYSIYTKATEVHIEKAFNRPRDFHEYVKRQKGLGRPSDSYRNVEFRYADINGLSPFCVRYSNKFEDHTGENANKLFFLVKKTGILCMHPEAPQNGIDMYYMERSLSSSSEPSSLKEGEQFLSSLRFHPLVN